MQMINRAIFADKLPDKGAILWMLVKPPNQRSQFRKDSVLNGTQLENSVKYVDNFPYYFVHLIKK